MTASTVITTLGILLALLLISAAWTGRKPTWQIVSGPPQESQNRLALTEFYAAARQQGWDFLAEQDLFLDLAIGLREAALDGAIEIWGRKQLAIGLPAAPKDVLVKIPAEYWQHHEIDGLRMARINSDTGMIEGLETNNFSVSTRNLPARVADVDHTTYRDLHLNFIQATDWLQTDAEAYKGISRRGTTR